LTSKFYFVGDLCLAGWNNDNNHTFSTTCREWQDLTNQAELTVANLETCIVENESECERFMAVPPATYGAIAGLGIDVFSLANNHILDCGEKCLNFTQAYLHGMGIHTVGAGNNIKEATAPLIITKNGKRIGIISTTDATHYKAKRNRAGISPLSLRLMKKSIADIINDVDLVILCIHSDLEFTNYPAPWKVRLSRKLARAGADIIVHHHPHTLQGIEIFEGSLIAYSLGNFIFPVHSTEYMHNRSGNVNEAGILEIIVSFNDRDSKNISYNFIPTVIDEDNITKFADATEADNIHRKISEYSNDLSNWKSLRKIYLQLCLQQANKFVWGTYYTLCNSGIMSTYKYLRVHFSTRMHRNWMRGLLTLGWF
jgi:hypothetical protein